jgi:hypothetical protein
MPSASCHCGAVTLGLSRPPDDLTDCNCTICRRYGTLWAYFSPRDVAIAGATDAYCWGEKKIEFHRCKACGCITHWSPVDRTRDRMGINARMLPPESLEGVRVRRLDGLSTWKYLDP